MPIVGFSLSEEGVYVLHDMLACMGKFSETVSLEARRDTVKLSTFNSTKSAYACFTLDPERFFSRYSYSAKKDRFHCTMLIPSLLPVFAKRTAQGLQPALATESAIDCCDVSIEDAVGTHSRFIAKVVKRNGIAATHRLPFEPLPPARAKFDKDSATNVWEAPSRSLRLLLDHFGPGTELLDIYLDEASPEDPDAVVNFRCFTEKTLNGDHVLKKPLQTSIAVAADEFDDINVEENLHIIITVRDFKALVQHANLVNTAVIAHFSCPSSPIHLEYPGDGYICEFLLTTVGERAGDGSRRRKAKHANARQNRKSLDAASRASSVARPSAPPRGGYTSATPATSRPPGSSTTAAPPDHVLAGSLAPTKLTGASDSRSHNWSLRPDNVLPLPRPNIDSESLFVTQDDDYDPWAPYNDDDDHVGNPDTLGWGPSGFDVSSKDSGSSTNVNPVPQPGEAARNAPNAEEAAYEMPSGLEPTQKLSDVRKFGLFS